MTHGAAQYDRVTVGGVTLVLDEGAMPLEEDPTRRCHTRRDDGRDSKCTRTKGNDGDHAEHFCGGVYDTWPQAPADAPIEWDEVRIGAAPKCKKVVVGVDKSFEQSRSESVPIRVGVAERVRRELQSGTPERDQQMRARILSAAEDRMRPMRIGVGVAKWISIFASASAWDWPVDDKYTGADSHADHARGHATTINATFSFTEHYCGGCGWTGALPTEEKRCPRCEATSWMRQKDEPVASAPVCPRREITALLNADRGPFAVERRAAVIACFEWEAQPTREEVAATLTALRAYEDMRPARGFRSHRDYIAAHCNAMRVFRAAMGRTSDVHGMDEWLPDDAITAYERARSR